MRRHRILEPAVQRIGRDAAVPHRVGVDHRLHQPVEALAVQAGDRDDRHALDLRQPVVGLGAQLAGRACPPSEVPLVHAEHQRPALALHQVGDAQVLLLERPLGVHQHDHHLGEADRVERVGDRELLQLLLDARACAACRRCRTGGTRGPSIRASTAMASRVMPASGPVSRRSSPSRRLISVDLPTFGPADHRDADRTVGAPSSVSSSSSAGAAVCSGKAARIAS